MPEDEWDSYDNDALWGPDNPDMWRESMDEPELQ